MARKTYFELFKCIYYLHSNYIQVFIVLLIHSIQQNLQFLSCLTLITSKQNQLRSDKLYNLFPLCNLEISSFIQVFGVYLEEPLLGSIVLFVLI
jgi:hypothetical protein